MTKKDEDIGLENWKSSNSIPKRTNSYHLSSEKTPLSHINNDSTTSTAYDINQQETRNNNPTSDQNNGNVEVNTLSPLGKAQKSTQSRFLDSIKAAIPAPSQIRKTMKASIALLIATIFIFDSSAKSVIGESVLLVAIVVIFYFPVRTLGKLDFA